MDNYIEELKRRIEDLRKERGMTRAQLAKAAGASPSTVTEWYSKGVKPGVDYMIRLSKSLGVSLDWLLTETGPKERQPTGTDPYQAAWREAAAELRALAESFDKRAGKAPGPSEEPGEGEPTGPPPGEGPSASGQDALDRHLKRRQSPGGTGTDG